MKKKANQDYFTNQLLRWNKELNKREMPWKGEKDPYKIWLSEIILQQTRVNQGLEYYNRFVKAFPTVEQLAKAPENKIFKLWEGLGYYTRCKNLIASAKYIYNDLGGEFPDTYETILALKGVGPYTAAAIGSFAFNLPRAVLDGNVFRVLARYFGIDAPIDGNDGKKLFSLLAEELLDKKKPAMYNQALMDFGAIVCKPQLPLCSDCRLKKKCVAYLNNNTGQLPLKEKTISRKTRWFYYFVLQYNNQWHVHKRSSKDIWENLYEFMLVENDQSLTIEELLKRPAIKAIMQKKSIAIKTVSGIYKQQLTHQTICGQFISLTVTNPLHLKGFELVDKTQIDHLPFPKFISNYLKDKTVSLNMF
ncbi:MAG: A/G-specific adenine glycosylase [Chitinophagaceae bacterium]|nr:A/G-specific adenine glycosylase [Chitinophagaceae bacterium]